MKLLTKPVAVIEPEPSPILSPAVFGDVKLRPFSRLLEKTAEREIGKEDIVVPFSDLSFSDEMGAIDIKSHGRVLVTTLAFQQLCMRLKIPSDYMERCPLTLRNTNLSYWVQQNDERRVLLRIRKFPLEQIDKDGIGILRAVLPQTYQPIDNPRIIEWVGAAVEQANGDLGIQSAQIRETSTHVRLLFRDPRALQDDDPLYFGVHLSDSEVGERGFSVDMVTFRPAHETGFLHLVDGNHLVTQRHIHIDFKLLRRNVADCFAIAREQIENVWELVQSARRQAIRDPHTYIRRLLRHYRLTNDFAETSIVAYEAEPDPTKFGIALAISRAARRMDLDMRVDTEGLMGSYLLEGA
jgi:hypothetical protein